MLLSERQIPSMKENARLRNEENLAAISGNAAATCLRRWVYRAVWMNDSAEWAESPVGSLDFAAHQARQARGRGMRKVLIQRTPDRLYEPLTEPEQHQVARIDAEAILAGKKRR